MLAFEKYTLYTIQGGKLLAGPYENYRDLLETVKLMMQMMMGWCCGKFEKLDKVRSRGSFVGTTANNCLCLSHTAGMRRLNVNPKNADKFSQ